MLICRDGRLRENDCLLAIDGHLLGEKSSLEDAVHWLQVAAGRVTLVVAHKPDSAHPPVYSTVSLAAAKLPAGEFTVTHHYSQIQSYHFQLSVGRLVPGLGIPGLRLGIPRTRLGPIRGRLAINKKSANADCTALHI